MIVRIGKINNNVSLAIYIEAVGLTSQGSPREVAEGKKIQYHKRALK